MNSPADAIPDLERLMRDVLRRMLEGALGATWLDHLSVSIRQAIKKAAELAQKQRPGEALHDDWDAAGIGEIAAILRFDLASRRR